MTLRHSIEPVWGHFRCTNEASPNELMALAVRLERRGVIDAHASGGTHRSSGTAGAIASLTFTGTSIDWITAMGPGYSKAKVLIDGNVIATEDLFAKTQQWQVVRTYGGLAAGTHNFQIKALGTKRWASKGTKVVVDAFSGPITVAGTAVQGGLVCQDTERANVKV